MGTARGQRNKCPLKRVRPKLLDAVADALEASGGNQPVVVAETIESPTGEQRTLMVTFDPTIPDGPAGSFWM